MTTATPKTLISSPRGRQRISRLLRLSTPLIRAVAGLYRRTLLRRTCVVVVVGSFGKTTTGRALSLGLTGSISRWLQNNAAAWPALTLLRTRPSTPLVVIEVGIQGPGMMAPHARVLRPDVVVVTSIGSEHNRSFKTLEATREEKSLMVEALRESGTAVLNGDDPHVLWMQSRTSAPCVTFGHQPGVDVRASEVALDWPHGTRMVVEIGTDRYPVETRLLGKASLNAILATFAVAHARNLPLEPLAKALAAFEPTRSRLQPVEIEGGRWLIRDEEKSALETIEVALEVMAQIRGHRKICVLGSINEPVGPQGDLYRAVGEQVAKAADLAIFIGRKQETRRLRSGAMSAGMARESIHAVSGALEALETARSISREGDVILVKGRGVERLERISLGLMGREVRCGVKICQLKLMNCDFCTRLGTGWPGNPERVS